MRNKMLKSLILLATICAAFYMDSYCQQSSHVATNHLTMEEQNEGWELLFDGKTSSGWRGVNKATFPEQGWEIKDGVLTVLGKKGGDILTERKYGDFDMKIEFKVKAQEATSNIYEKLEDNPFLLDSFKGFEKHLSVHGIDISEQLPVLGPKLLFDSEMEAFHGSNSKMANLYLKDTYREPFQIPEDV